MAEMDIYMRRRLVALGGLVAFFIIFVLLVKSCGGDDEPTNTVSTPAAGATGVTGGALAPELFIEEADGICAQANLAVSGIDPAATDAAQQEYGITNDELKSLQGLQQAEASSDIDKFLNDLGDVVSALKAKAQAEKSGDIAGEDAAQLEIDTAEVAARESGEKAGFADCGQFLDAGEEAPAGGGGGGGNNATTETGGGIAPPADTGGTTPPADDTGGTTPPADDGTTTPPADDSGGGITP
jgi:hypothetical protein